MYYFLIYVRWFHLLFWFLSYGHPPKPRHLDKRGSTAQLKSLLDQKQAVEIQRGRKCFRWLYTWWMSVYFCSWNITLFFLCCVSSMSVMIAIRSNYCYVAGHILCKYLWYDSMTWEYFIWNPFLFVAYSFLVITTRVPSHFFSFSFAILAYWNISFL